MAFTVQLRKQHGEVIDEFVLASLPVAEVPPLDDPSSAALRFIDPYGDTMLNAAQCAALVDELTAGVQTRQTTRLDWSRSRRDALRQLISTCGSSATEYAPELPISRACRVTRSAPNTRPELRAQIDASGSLLQRSYRRSAPYSGTSNGPAEPELLGC